MATATKTVQQTPKPVVNGVKHDEDQVFQHAFGELCQIVSNCADSDGFKKMKGLLEENQRLQERLRNVETANQENFNAAADFSAQLKTQSTELENTKKDVSSQKEEIKELKSQLGRKMAELQANGEELTHLQNKIKEQAQARERLQTDLSNAKNQAKDQSASMKDLKDRLKDAEGILRQTNQGMISLREQLSTLDSFVIPRVPLNDMKRTVEGNLASIFAAAFRFMEELFLPDLAQDTTANPLVWEALKKANYTCVSIPLPASNSPAAKQMRMAVGLGVLANALHQHVFHPVYFSRDVRGVTNFLNLIGDQEPDLEYHTRSVLHKTVSYPPRTAGKLTTEEALCGLHAAAAGKDASDALAGIIPDTRKKTFQHDVRQLCHEIARIWMPFQKMREKIALEWEYEQESWKPLVLPQLPRSSSPGAKSAGAKQSNGPDNSPQNGKQRQNPNSSQSDHAVQPPLDVECEIWPAFTADDDDLTVLHVGYALTKAQVKQAEEEAKREEMTSRVARSKSRRTGERRGSRPFLGTGSGGNSPVD